jgi:hypothetical protein
MSLGKKFVILLSILALAGCMTKDYGEFQPLPEAETPHTHFARIPDVTINAPVTSSEKKEPKAEAKISKPKEYDEILLSWKVPTSPVDKFVIYFGFSKQLLDKKVEVAAKDLKESEDPRFGPVYKYYLIDVPVDKTIYVSIMAIKGKEASKMGEVIELKSDFN